MIINSCRSKARKKGQKLISSTIESRNGVLAVHYSCESIKLTKSGTARVTSISIYNISTKCLTTFCLHLEAERLGYHTDKLSHVELDAAERSMLHKFYGFAKKHRYYTWVHWNMKNSTYGFEALENRFTILSRKLAFKLRAQNRLDLSSILVDLYGTNYENDSCGNKLIALAKRNKFNSSGILSGEQEAYEYTLKNYPAIMRSNHDKAEAIGLIFEAAGRNILKTDASFFDIYGLDALGLVLYIGDNITKIKKIASGISGLIILWNSNDLMKLYKYIAHYLDL